MRPSPLLATSWSQWAQRSTISSGKTSTSPWQSSRPLRGEPRRGLHSTYPPLKRDALCRGIISCRLRRPIVGPPHLCATRVAAPRASAVLPSHPRPCKSWDPRSPACSARRPHVALRSRAMLFVSSHYGHARGTLYFFPVRPVQWGLPMLSVLLRLPTPRFVAPPTPPQRLAATLRRPFTHVVFVAKRHDSWRFQHPFFAPQKSISIFRPTPRGFSSWDTTTLPFVASRGVRIHPLFRVENCII